MIRALAQSGLGVLFAAALMGCPAEDQVSRAEYDLMLERLEELEAMQARVDDLEAKTAPLQTDESSVRFVGVDVYIQDGSGTTMGAEGSSGNLILGYNEGNPDRKTGSHNLVLGTDNHYLGAAGVVSGDGNTIGPQGFVIGGVSSRANEGVVIQGELATSDLDGVVIGGLLNEAAAPGAVVVGGRSNQANGDFSVILGGEGSVTSTESEIKP